MTDQPQPLNEKAQFEVVWALMAELGIGEIQVSFNGEGDSGDINDIAAVPPDHAPVWAAQDPTYQARHNEWNERTNKLNQAMRTTRTGIVRDIYENALYPPGMEPPTTPADGITLDELVRALTWPMLDAIQHDWVNNEGGYGTVRWDLTDQHIVLELSIRIISTEEYSYEYDKYGAAE